MKNFFLLVILVLAFFSIDHKIIKEPREEFFGFITDFLNGSMKTTKDSAAKTANDRIKHKLQLTSAQSTYVDTHTKTSTKLRAFNTRFCVNNDLNLYFQGNDLRQVCQIIEQQVKIIAN